MNKYEEALYEVIRLCAQSKEIFPTEEIEILQELTDKATPKKVKSASSVYGDNLFNSGAYYCSNCNREIKDIEHDNFCSNCGQAIKKGE